MSDHVIRHATAEDYEAVLDIGDMYNGLDYMKHRYHLFITNSSVKCYVYVSGEKVIGFCAAFLVDDGSTLLIRDTRVGEKSKDHGVQEKLVQHVREEFQRLGTVKYETLATNSVRYGQIKDDLGKSYREMCQKDILTYDFKPSGIKIPSDLASKAQEVTSETDICATITETENIFPNGVFMIDWVPLRTISSNVNFIHMLRTKIFKTENQEGIPTCVTFGTCHLCKRGLRYVVDVYGRDLTHFRDHVIHHLRHAERQTDRSVIFQFFIDTKLKSIAESVIVELQISVLEVPYKKQYHLEKDFD